MATIADQYAAYCLRCKEYRQVGEPRYVSSNTGRQMIKGACVECGAEMSRYADDSSATSEMANISENLILPCPSCGERRGQQCVERQAGNAWNVGYPANIHSARAEITTPSVILAERETVKRKEAAEASRRAAERKEKWKEAGICFIIAVFVLLTLGLGALLLIATRKP